MAETECMHVVRCAVSNQRQTASGRDASGRYARFGEGKKILREIFKLRRTVLLDTSPSPLAAFRPAKPLSTPQWALEDYACSPARPGTLGGLG